LNAVAELSAALLAASRVRIAGLAMHFRRGPVEPVADRREVPLILALSSPSWAQVAQAEIVTLSGTAETIDQPRRLLNIKTPEGTFETVDVPPSAKRFDELKIGDKVLVTYSNTVSARLKPLGEAAVDTGYQGSTMGQEVRP
jgi:hypothetical protein